MMAVQFLKTNHENGFEKGDTGGWELNRESMKDLAHRFEDQRMALADRIESIIGRYFALMREVGLGR